MPASRRLAARVRGAAWFHVTGITPALGPKAAAAHARRRSRAAREAGARVSVDLNYRKKLWTEAEAQQVMRPLMPHVDRRDRERRGHAVGARHRRCQAPTSPAARSTSRPTASAAERVTRELGPSMVAITLRESLSASDNGWSAVLWDGGVTARSTRASATTCASSIASAAATALRRA